MNPKNVSWFAKIVLKVFLSTDVLTEWKKCILEGRILINVNIDHVVLAMLSNIMGMIL